MLYTNHVEVHTATADRPKINFGKSTGPTTTYQNFSQREVRPAAPPQIYTSAAPETRVEYRREPYAERVEYVNEPVRIDRTEYRQEPVRIERTEYRQEPVRVERVEYRQEPARVGFNYVSGPEVRREESYVRVSEARNPEYR